MAWHRSLQSQATRLITSLVFCAFLLRALVPVGFMPDIAGLLAGGMPLVICSGGMEKTVFVDADGQPLADHSVPAAEAPCLFAGLTPVPLPLLVLVLLLVLIWDRRADWSSTAPVRGHRPRPPGPLSARGPPCLA
jgi:hypothetical protein